jgi:phenylacetate-CoA ligase
MTAPAGIARCYQPDLEQLPRTALGALQRERLDWAVGYALERSAFHRDLWARAGLTASSIGGRADFTALAPRFTQADVTGWGLAHGDPFGGLCCLPRHEITFVGATSGTTGVPLALPQYAGNPRETATCRDLWEEDLRPGETILLLSPGYRSGFTPPGRGAAERLGLRVVQLEAGLGSAPAVLEAIRRFRPASMTIVNRPLVVELERSAAAQGITLDEVTGCFRGMVFGGEPLDAVLRDRLTTLFGRVRNQTGLGNTIAAVECRAADGHHTWEDLVLVEVLDPVSGHAVPEGEVGELVVTTLEERAMPLLRFRTQDLVRFSAEPCPCGRTHGRIWPQGRVGDDVRVGGRRLTPVVLFPAVAAVPEARDGVFQLVDSGAAVRVRVGRRTGRPDGIVRAELEAAIAAVVGEPVPVDLVEPDDIMRAGPRIKIRRIVREEEPRAR